MTAVVSLLASNGLKSVRFWPAHLEWQDDARFDAALAAARLVVINGEGTIHHNRLAGRRLLEAGTYAKAAGIPVALINTGWEDNGPDFLAMLNHFDLVAARDSRSAEQMALSGARVRVVPDLSLWHVNNQTSAKYLHPRAGIGFTDNVNRFKMLELMRLRRTCQGKSLSICYSKKNPSGWAQFLRDGISVREDLTQPALLAALLRARHELWQRSTHDTNAFIDQVANLELLVSGRFHACTLALATGTPIIANSSNTGKIAALFHDAGIEEWRGALHLDAEVVSEARARGWSASERDNLRAYLSSATQASEAMFSDLSNLATR
tara:strand:- start:13417 stop:14382 length:966 start_codon:yes stop_codon:yes gene_type:complete